MTTTWSPTRLPLRGSWRSRCWARITARTLRPIASRLAEMLVADAEYLRSLVEANAGTCALEIWPDQMHVFQALPRLSPEAGPTLARAAQFIRTELDHTSPLPPKHSNP